MVQTAKLISPVCQTAVQRLLPFSDTSAISVNMAYRLAEDFGTSQNYGPELGAK